MRLYTKQKQIHRHRKQTYGSQRRQVGGRVKLGVWELYAYIPWFMQKANIAPDKGLTLFT